MAYGGKMMEKKGQGGKMMKKMGMGGSYKKMGHGGYMTDAQKDRAQGFGIQNPSKSNFSCERGARNEI